MVDSAVDDSVIYSVVIFYIDNFCVITTAIRNEKPPEFKRDFLLAEKEQGSVKNIKFGFFVYVFVLKISDFQSRSVFYTGKVKTVFFGFFNKIVKVFDFLDYFFFTFLRT